MVVRIPLTQSQASETEIAGEVNWDRPRSGFRAYIVDKPDGMDCAVEHRRTGALVECWDDDDDDDDDKEKRESLLYSSKSRL